MVIWTERYLISFYILDPGKSECGIKALGSERNGFRSGIPRVSSERFQGSGSHPVGRGPFDGRTTLSQGSSPQTILSIRYLHYDS